MAEGYLRARGAEVVGDSRGDDDGGRGVEELVERMGRMGVGEGRGEGMRDEG